MTKKKSKQIHQPPQVKSNHGLGVLWQLEPRMMFDGAAVSTAIDVVEQILFDSMNQQTSQNNSADHSTLSSLTPIDTRILDAEGDHQKTPVIQLENELEKSLTNYEPPTGPANEIIFVDTRVENYETLLAEIDPNIQVVLLNSQKDGVKQMADYLTQHQSVEAIHIISHGSSGSLQLGTGSLTFNSMTQQYAAEMAVIKQALSEQADILIYGCDFAEGQAGQDAATLLSQLTGADVAASTDDTGYAGLGGDWDLELQTGTIKTHLAINYDVQADWDGLLSLTASGGETRVNTTTTGTQTHNFFGNDYTPDSVAMDANGNFVSVWESAGDIYGQRYNSAGTAQGSEFVIANNAANEGLANVTMNSSGAFVVTWERGLGTADIDIYARIYNSSGTAVGSEFLVNETTIYDQSNAKVAMDASGNFVVAWESNTEAGGTYYDDIYAQRYDSSGTKLGANFLLNTTTVGDQEQVDITMDSAGNFVTVWAGERTAGSSVYSIYGQRYNASGVAQGGEFLVNAVASNNDQHASVAMNDSGNFVVTWNRKSGSDSDIQAQRFDSSGVAQGSAISVTNTPSYWQDIASVAMGGGGNFVVSWSSDLQDGSGWGVYTRQYDSTGTALTTESRVSTTTANDQDHSSIAYQNGKVVVTWSGNGTGDSTGIFMQRYDAAGGNAAPTITSNGGGLTAAVSIAENTTTVTAVTATDADVGATRTYSISGGADAAKFTINSSTGALSFITAPNYESPTDTGGNNVYDVLVTVKDNNGGADSQSIAVTVTGINEAPINAVPGAQTTNEDTNLVFSSGNGNQISIQDPEGSGSAFEVTASVTNGTLTLAGTSGLTFVTGDGTTDSTMTFRGTVANINTALNGLSYNPTANYNGSATLTLASVDNTLVSLNIDANLQAHYTFDGTTNDMASGTAQNGTLMNGATYVTDGTRGQVLSLDGVNDYVTIAGTFSNPSEITIGGWVNLGFGTGRKEFISLDNRVHIALDDTSGVKGSVQIGANSWIDLNSNQFVAGTGWHHIMYSYSDSGNVHSLYIDGALVASATINSSIDWTSLPAPTNQTNIGRHPTTGGNFLNGLVDDARIYNRVLSAGEVAALATDLNLKDTDTVAITVNSVNDAPTDIVFGQESTAEQVVNTYTNSYQMSSSIAPLPSGGWVTVWISGGGQDGSGSGVYGQRFDADGNKVGTEFLVNQRTTDDQYGQVVSAFSDGRYVVTWVDQNAGVRAWIMARVFNADGTAATAEFQVSPGTDGNNQGYYPTVQVLDSNRFVVVWSNEAGADNWSQAGRIYNSAGVLQGAQFSIGTQTATGIWNSINRIDRLADGGFAVTWRYDSSSAQLRLFNSDGSARTAAIALPGNDVADVAVLRNGNVAVAYADGGDINAVIYNASGVLQVGEFNVNAGATSGTQSQPRITASDDGFVVAWNSDTGDGSSLGVFAQRFTASGSSVGGVVQVNTTTVGAQFEVDLIQTSTGQVRVVWSSQNLDGSEYGVASRVLGTPGATVAENAANGTWVADALGFRDVDSTSGTYSLVNSAGGRFAINSSTGEITVANGALLDYEAATSHSVTVRVTDSGGMTYDETFTINLTNVNEAPTGTDATVTINEDTSRTVTAANFGFSDVDAGDSLSAVRIDTLPGAGSLTLSGVAVTAGQVVSLANITAGNLVFTPVANANGTGYASFTFSVRDSNNTYDAASNTLTFNITAVNDAPIISTGNLVADGSFERGGAAWRSNSVLEVSNSLGNYGIAAPPDGGYFIEVEGWTHSGVPSWIEQTISTVAGKTYQFTVAAVTRNDVNVSDKGILSIDGTQVLAFTTGSTWSDFTKSFVATSSSTTIRITSDGSASGYTNPGDGVGLIVDNVRVVENSPVTFVENGSAVVLTSTGSVFDTELSAANSFSGATLMLARNGGANTEDVFSATGTLSLSGGNVVVSGTTIGTYTNSGGSLAFTFNSNATNVLVNSAIRQIAYSNSSDNPPSSIPINWTFNDNNSGAQGSGGALQATGSTTVYITAVNDAPTDLALSANTVAENAANGTSVGTVSTTDPDNGDTQSYSLTDTAGGRFAINGSTGEITVANGALLDYEAATSHSVTVRVTDSGGLTYDETFTINLTNINEAPTGADAIVTINEDTSHTATAANFGFSDVDAGDSLSAVRIDTLPGAGSLTLSGVAVTAGQIVSLADITAGNLVFTPVAG
ncbi:cadherin domain-containing protein, partial [Nitrosomonas sp. Nm84]|uniref:DUF4347 domain-containing protein n=1 Tax=Nitrosomonas sp. Nm84 TaxID=200124 RepID=UPI000D94B724